MSVVSVFSEKGGTGKTSICFSLGRMVSSSHSFRVVHVDTDSQGNSKHLGVLLSKKVIGGNLVDVMLGEDEGKDCFSRIDSLDVVSNDERMVAMFDILNENTNRDLALEYVERFNAFLRNLKLHYDVVFVDCGPSKMSTLTRFSVPKSDFVLVPFTPYSVGDVEKTLDSVEYCLDNGVACGLIVNMNHGLGDFQSDENIARVLGDPILARPGVSVLGKVDYVGKVGFPIADVNVSFMMKTIVRLLPECEDVGSVYERKCRRNGNETEKRRVCSSGGGSGQTSLLHPAIRRPIR